MFPKTFSAQYRFALATVGCAILLTLNAAAEGRRTLRGHLPQTVARLKPAGTLAETNRLRLALGLQPRNQDKLATLLRDLYDPSSPDYHHYLKPAEFAERFGPTEEDYATVRAFAESHGLQVVKTHTNRLLLDVEASVTDVKSAFHINLVTHKHPSEKRLFYAPDTEPSVETNIPLLHIAGLDNYLLPQSNIRVRGGNGPTPAVTGSGPDGTFIGHDFRNAYVPGVTLTGTGQTVALVEFDTFAARDITAYEHAAGLPNVPVTPIPIDGFSGSPGGGQDEVSLDIEMAISMAPGLAQVLCYEAPYEDTSVNDDLFNQIAEDDLANQISCSWYYTIDAETDFIFSEMAAQGQSFFNASGDVGAYYFDVYPPMGDPNIIIVGGTTLTTSGSSGPWASETVWNWFNTSVGTDGSSGGSSSIYAIPYWQQSVNMSSNMGSTLARNIPDISMTADNVYVYSASAGETVGGTSCAAPLWAGFTALVNQQAAQNSSPPVGFLNPAIYAMAQSALYPSLFHDTTKGNNTNYNGSTKYYAVPGYDLCTGWGTPNGQALINALAPPPDGLIIGPRGGLSFEAATFYPTPIEDQTLTLKASASDTNSVQWALGPIPSWLDASVTHGTLSPGQAGFVTLSDDDSATNLPPGSYVTNLLVTNLTTGTTHLVPVYLTVFDPLIISPDAGLTVTAPPGGPFDLDFQIYSLTNFAYVPLQWSVSSTLPYFDIFPTGGTLQPGDSADLIVTIDPSATNVLISSLTGSLVFTDLLATNQQALPLALTVGNGGFETGDFTNWTQEGVEFTNYNAVYDVTPQSWEFVHSGEFGAFLGEVGDVATLSEDLPTVSNQLYQISFFLNNPALEEGVANNNPNQFTVLWGGTTAFSQTNMPIINWTNVHLTFLATNTNTVLTFEARNDPAAFGFDDISVAPVTLPIITSATISGNSLVFTWAAIPGTSYELQASTLLTTNESAWSLQNHAFVATNAVMTTTAVVRRADQQQFFRFKIVPNTPQ